MAPHSNIGVIQVHSTAIEGRMRDLRHRQKQLLSLHQQLVDNESEIISTLRADDCLTADEASFILASTLSEIQTHYDSLDLKKELKDEYGIRWARSNDKKRTLWPLAFVITDRSGVFYNVLSTLAAATESGTCCVFKLENDLLSAPALLGRIFALLYDKEAVSITTTIPELKLLRECYIVNQVGDSALAESMRNLKPKLRSLPESINLGVVDRTADIHLAAESLVVSRLAFGAASRQAVDCIFVNEFVMQEFIDAVIKVVESWSGQVSEGKRHLKNLETLVADGYERVYDKPAVCHVLQRTSARQRQWLPATKISSYIVAVNAFSSLDDVIDRVSNGDMKVGALYVFAGLKQAKYLSQFIPTRVTFVNHIPRKFQIGPSPPVGYAVSATTRYTREMFEFCSPQFVTSNTRGRDTGVTEVAESLLKEAKRPLKPTGQPKAGAVGFFDVGAMVGAAVYLLLPGVVGLVSIGFGIQRAFRYFSE